MPRSLSKPRPRSPPTAGTLQQAPAGHRSQRCVHCFKQRATTPSKRTETSARRIRCCNHGLAKQTPFQNAAYHRAPSLVSRETNNLIFYYSVHNLSSRTSFLHEKSLLDWVIKCHSNQSQYFPPLLSISKFRKRNTEEQAALFTFDVHTV